MMNKFLIHFQSPKTGILHDKSYHNFSAVIDYRNYRLSEYSQNDTCRLLMAISIHKRHVKITASSYRQDVTLMLNGIKTHWQPDGSLFLM